MLHGHSLFPATAFENKITGFRMGVSRNTTMLEHLITYNRIYYFFKHFSEDSFFKLKM